MRGIIQKAGNSYHLRFRWVVSQFAIRPTEAVTFIEERMSAPRFREDKLRGHDAKGN